MCYNLGRCVPNQLQRVVSSVRGFVEGMVLRQDTPNGRILFRLESLDEGALMFELISSEGLKYNREKLKRLKPRDPLYPPPTLLYGAYGFLAVDVAQHPKGSDAIVTFEAVQGGFVVWVSVRISKSRLFGRKPAEEALLAHYR